ncbi:MAG: hypothetical protein ACLP7O_10545 [Terracidiphilus sp.]
MTPDATSSKIPFNLVFWRRSPPASIVASRVIEAGCKTVIGSRLKQSGIFWTVRGANPIIVLRCGHLNGHFKDYWKACWRPDLHFYVAHSSST